MDLLIVDAIESEVLQWLEARHRVRHAPELAREPRALRQSLFNVRGLVLPSSVRIDEETLSFAPLLRVVARVAPGLENIDVDACARAGVEVVRGAAATAPAEAEFMIGALIALLRPGGEGGRVTPGRELASATVGLIGMAPAARFLSAMLSGFGSRLVGYDPTLHASDLLWGRWRIEPMGLRELLQTADAVCVQLPYYSRYQGLIGERYLPQCKPGMVLVSTSHSALFDVEGLGQALRSGRIAGAWLDSVEPGLLDPERPLHGLPTLRTSSRLAGYTQESRVRAVWAVAHRVDEVLNQAPRVAREFRPSAAAPLNGPVSMPGPLGGPVSGPVPLDEAEPFSPAVDAAAGPAPASS
ncbi:MAG TPA: NAD(P)-dependent oxidoreductase [Methylibium sp.]|nr:NAD(P)-dependent oxidoreductase [Methylibium sp.]